MKNEASCQGTACRSCMFCPHLVGVVAGLIMLLAGTAKFMAGKAMLAGVGGMALGIFGLDGGAYATLALTLGSIAATIEVVGGLSVMIGCCKTGKYAAVALSLVMLVAIAVKLSTEGAMSLGFLKIFQGIQFDLLLLAVFVQKAYKGFRCCMKKSCCTTACDTGSAQK